MSRPYFLLPAFIEVLRTISLLNRGGIITERKTDAIGAGSGDITIKGKQLNLDRGNISVEATNEGGNLQIATQDGISIRNNSNISTSATNGKAGDISLTSPQITLDTSKINAQSNSGRGGNIKVTGADLLLLRRGAQISTDAGGTAQAGDDGGNITIDSKLLVALSAENSDIDPKNRNNGYDLAYTNITRAGMSGGPVFDAAGRIVAIHGQGDRNNQSPESEAKDGILEEEKTGFNLGIPMQTFLKLQPQAIDVVGAKIDDSPLNYQLLDRSFTIGTPDQKFIQKIRTRGGVSPLIDVTKVNEQTIDRY